ncbi:hypothetical protein GEMRC1_008484 [Eukaryota sp. GEM-RC1]
MKIATHDGKFHADESFAVFLLTQLPSFAKAEIIRTRDSSIYSQCDAVVDVGGVFDTSTCRFDHHQLGFTETFPGFSTKLSSAGLCYREFGKTIIQNRYSNTLSNDHLILVHTKLYRSFVEAIDAIDNGIDQYDLPPNTTPKYCINTDLSKRVGNLNGYWNQTVDVNAQFHKAVKLVGEEFLEALDYLVSAHLPARSLVKEAFDNRFSVDSSGSIILLSTPCPWKEILLEIEGNEDILFCIFGTEDGKYRVCTVPQSSGSFAFRKGLLEEWRGLRGDELVAACNVEDVDFVHKAGFIGGALSLEGALKMAKLSLG